MNKKLVFRVTLALTLLVFSLSACSARGALPLGTVSEEGGFDSPSSELISSETGAHSNEGPQSEGAADDFAGPSSGGSNETGASLFGETVLGGGSDERGAEDETGAAATPPEAAKTPSEAAETGASGAYAYSPPSSPLEPYTAAVASAGLNVRKGAGTSFGVLFSLSAGRSLPYLWEEGGWYAVWTGSRVGFISKNYAYIAKTCGAIENVISAGLDKLGTPYEWGAARIIGDGGKPNPYFTGRTFDCSSFVQYCFYVGAGVKLGAYTGSQSDFTAGKKIWTYSALSRGDIFFTGTGGRISHVVIYLGGGKLLQCYSASGGPVSLTAEDRWKKNFISGRRVDLTVKDQFGN